MENFQDHDDPQQVLPAVIAGPSQPSAAAVEGRPIQSSPISPITINLIGTISRSQQAMVSGIINGTHRFNDTAPEPAGAAHSNLNGDLAWEVPRPRGPGRPPLSRRGGRGQRVSQGAGRVGPYGMPQWPQFSVAPLAPAAAVQTTPPAYVTRSTQTPAASPVGCRCRRVGDLGILDTCGHLHCVECKNAMLQNGAVCTVDGCNVQFNASNFVRMRL